MTARQFAELFPGLKSPDAAAGAKAVYFDNAATSQRPAEVTDAMADASLHSNANIHRAVHSLAAKATDLYEASRDAAREFLNAASRQEIIFTSGATAAINLVAYSFSEQFIREGDEIITGEAEHHSNLVPWQIAAKRKGAIIKYLRCRQDGRYSPDDLAGMLTPRTKIVCIGHASNVLGILNPVREIVQICHSRGIIVLVDGAQGAVHSKVDVQSLGCDFYAFSAHKLYGPTGVGVLCGRKELLEQMPPWQSGGEMVGAVSLESTTFAPLPAKFEAGTQNFNAVAALAPALKIAAKSLDDKELNEEFEETRRYLYDALIKIDGLHLYGQTDNMEEKLPVFSFTIDGVHHEDVAILLDKMGVAVRSGQMCAEPLMTHFGVTGMLRASLLPYNTKEEAAYFVKCLEKAVKMLK